MIWFKFYSAWGDGIQELSNEEAGRFIKAVCNYAETGKVEPLSGVERILFAIVLKQMKQDAEHAEKVSNVRAEARRGKGKEMISNDINCEELISNESKDNNCAIKNKELRIQNSEQRIKNSEEEQEERVNARDRKAEPKHRYGRFQHVLLTDAEYGKILLKFNDWERRIQNLDDYLENNRKKHYDNHYLTILNWARRDDEQKPVQPVQPKRESWVEIAERMAREEVRHDDSQRYRNVA